MHVAFPCLPGVNFGLTAACKGVNRKRLRKILLTVLCGTFNSRLVLRVDFLGLRKKDFEVINNLLRDRRSA